MFAQDEGKWQGYAVHQLKMKLKVGARIRRHGCHGFDGVTGAARHVARPELIVGERGFLRHAGVVLRTAQGFGVPDAMFEKRTETARRNRTCGMLQEASQHPTLWRRKESHAEAAHDLPGFEIAIELEWRGDAQVTPFE